MPFYTSQSATSTYQSCPRKRWFQNHLFGQGIVSKYKSVPLVTGGMVHTAVQEIAGNSTPLDDTIKLVQKAYDQELKNKNFTGTLPSEQERIYLEQRALIEVLIRLWYMLEWPKIQQFFHILAVEQEIAIEVSEDLWYQSKPDLLLIHKETGELVNYSLKTVKQVTDWYGTDKAEQSYYVANQTFTEPWFTYKWLEREKDQINMALGLIQNVNRLPYGGFGKKFDAVEQVLNKYLNGVSTTPSKIRFCFLIKGRRDEMHKGQGDYYTNNPFLYGYRNHGPREVNYAWADKIIKPENKSGFGKLGKGWEWFPIFENNNDTSIEAWFNLITSGEIQPELGNPAEQHVLTQPDINVHIGQCEKRVDQLIQIEQRVQHAVGILEQDEKADEGKHREWVLDREFPMNTHSCFYPTTCEYLTICPNGNRWYKDHIAIDPLSEEWEAYEKRVPHHETEKRKLEEKRK